ncbi:MAG: cytosolic protein, partial [Symploca sp. SIO3C6]|nr:cytosolic protein [Symploca sp. SIO3C6]
MVDSCNEFDSPWKEAIEEYFEDYMVFFFPFIPPDIDWTRGYDFLDKELQQVVRDAVVGKRWADKLVKVWRQDGQETWVLIHIEIQSQEEADFAQRMYTYNYRLRDRYGLPIISLAVLGDERHTWRPDRFRTSVWQCTVDFQFPIVKLLDY